MKKKIFPLKEEAYSNDQEQLGFDFDFLVYAYESGSYDGSGFAVWKRDKDFFYHEMGHCSCYGPWDQVEKSNGVVCTFDQIKSLIKDNYYNDHAKTVIDFIEKKKLQNK